MQEFVLVETHPLEIVNGTLYRYRHHKSGATVLYMETAALEKTFTLQFRTLPTSHNGVCHIIEHAVFCGSRKYQVKDPFAELAKTSLQTYLNAITYPDRTVYPFATTNDQDFFNLLDIYLDAVFYPNFLKDPRILAQEGWHYELDEAGDLMVNGIVYNEMKGMLASPENALTVQLMTHLFDNTYQWHAAGNPKDIPNLTHQEMVDFYQAHYHPAQAVMAIYGAVDIEAVLARLVPYLDREGEAPQPLEVPATTNFVAPKLLRQSYPSASPDEALSLTGIGLVHGQLVQPEDIFALRLLTSILFTMESSPIKQALVDKELASDIYADFDDTLRQPYTMITLLDSDECDLEAIADLVRTQLQHLVVEGLDQDLIKSVINQWQFLLLEGFENQGLPKGIMLSLDALAQVDRGGSPAEKLDYAGLLARLMAQYEQGYFERLIQTHYLDNPHWLYLSFAPSLAAYEAETMAQQQALQAYQASLSPSDLAQIEADLLALKTMQETPNTESDLASLPKLAVADLAKTLPTCPYKRLDHRLEAYAVQSSADQSRAIQQVAILFGQPQLTLEDLPYLNLLSHLLGYLGTQSRDAFSLSNELAEKTGTTYFWARVFQNGDEVPYVAIQYFCKYLKDQEAAVLDLLADMAYQTLWTDEVRLYQCLTNLAQNFEYDVLDRSNELAYHRLRAYLSVKGLLESYLSGWDFYWFLRELLEHFDEKKAELMTRLASLYTQAFDKKNASVVYQADGGQAFLDKLDATLRTSQHQAVAQCESWDLVLTNESQAFVIEGEVNAVALGYDFKRLGYAHSGALEVARKYLNAEYLWDQIRVLGGAYGAELTVTAEGTLVATSFRDPNLLSTLEAMKGMGAALGQLPQDISGFIVGTAGELSRPIPEMDRIHHVISAIFDGYTDQLRQRLYDEVLACQPADLKAVAGLLDQAMHMGYQTALISPEKIREARQAFQVSPFYVGPSSQLDA